MKELDSLKIAEDWAEDYAYLLKGVTLMFFHKKPPRCYIKNAAPGKVPVVLVPGILGTWASMKRLGDKLSSAGHPVYVVPDLGHNIEDIPSSSKKLEAVVKKIIKNGNDNCFGGKPIKGVVLVAHSKGGLIGKYFLAHHNEDGGVLRVIAIATPFSGSDMAKLVLAEPFRELESESDVINELKRHATVNNKIISIIPEFDNHVWAEEGSFLEGAQNIKVSVKGHHKVLFSEEVEDTVLSKVEECETQNFLQ